MKTFQQFLEANDAEKKPKKEVDSDTSDTELVNGGDKDEIEDGSEDETNPKKDTKGKGTVANMIRNESLPPVGPAMSDMEKEQQAVYDAQTIQFKKDAKANSELKAKPMKESLSFKTYLDEISTDAKHKYVAAARKSVSDLGREAQAAALKGDKETMKKKAEKLVQRNDTAIRTMGKADIETRKKWNSDFGKNEAVECKHDDTEEDKKLIKKMVKKDAIKDGVKESVFDWKKNKSEVNWKSDDKKSSDSTVHKGTYGSDTHVAPSDRKADGKVEKKNVGRPTGKYGEYKIDRAKREDPNAKSELSKKVMAAKAQGFKDRHDFKLILNRGIAAKQLKNAGLNPADHEDAISKVAAKAAGKLK